MLYPFDAKMTNKATTSTVFMLLVVALSTFCQNCHANSNNSSSLSTRIDPYSSSLTLVPAVEPLAIADHDKNTTMLFQVESSDDPSVICIMSSGSNAKVCGAYFVLDLQAKTKQSNLEFLQVAFQAPSGYEFEMGSLNGVVNFEFLARNVNSTEMSCDIVNPQTASIGAPHEIAPRMFEVTSDLPQNIPNTFSTPHLVGTSGVEKLTVDRDLSFARVSACEIYFKIQFTGLALGETVRLSQMSFLVAYDSSSTLWQEAQEFHCQSSGPMGIKAFKPQLVAVTQSSLSKSSDNTSSPDISSVLSSIRGAVYTNTLQSMNAEMAPTSSDSPSVRLTGIAFTIIAATMCSFFIG